MHMPKDKNPPTAEDALAHLDSPMASLKPVVEGFQAELDSTREALKPVVESFRSSMEPLKELFPPGTNPDTAEAIAIGAGMIGTADADPDPAEDDPDRPDDLIGYKEAMRISERSRVTIQRWLRDGFLEKYEAPSSNGRTPRTLLSKSELISYLVSIDQKPKKQKIAPIGTPDEHANWAAWMAEEARKSGMYDRDHEKEMTVLELEKKLEASELRIEVEQLRGKVLLAQAAQNTLSAAYEGQLSTLEAKLSAAERRATRAEVELAGVREEMKLLQEKVEAERSEKEELRKLQSRSWWRRLLS